MRKGRVTIPGDASFVEETKRIADLWGADAVRDCDGTSLGDNPKQMAEKVYYTYFIVRGDNKWAAAHPEETHRTFLCSDRVVAQNGKASIIPAKGFLKEQIEPDWEQLARWQVFDRTTGEEIHGWTADEKNGTIIVKGAQDYHEYTVNFMAKVLWHPVQIYNYLTNSWTCEKQKMYDPSFPYTKEYVKSFAEKWCEDHPEINVVRFTTFLYQFSLIFNELGREKYVDWFGYTLAASPVLLDEFEQQYGYKLTSEDIVDNGCYNNPFRVPNKKYLDYMDFVERRVTKTVRELVDIVHSHGKEAMMFLGDDWIGAEPYGEYFKDLNLDAVVGSVGGGVTVRMLAEIPYVKYREGRFLPYFFPDTFFDGNEKAAVDELNRNWTTARRAMMRSPLDRMGFGGYLSLAAKFPSFIDRVTEICDEFRRIYDAAAQAKPHSALTVAILNSWGKKRSWMCHMVAHELWYQQTYSYSGVLEALSGQAVNVKFISFDDIMANGIGEDIDVILNVGDADTAYSGGEIWNDSRFVQTIRRWVYEGHGFIGVGEPTACANNGRFFALSDVLGVEKEKGFTLSEDKYNIDKKAHFITEDVVGEIDFGEGQKGIYALDGTDVLDIAISDRCMRKVNVGEVRLAAKQSGKGRGVYIAGLPYNPQNARLLYRAMFWAAGKEQELKKVFSSNIHTECNYYPNIGKYAIVNNSDETQTTIFYDVEGKARSLTISPSGIIWVE